MRGRLRGVRGEATTQLVLLTPVLLVLMLAVIQMALWWHAAHLADGAAHRGAVVAARVDGDAGEGAAAASSFASAAGAELVGAPLVERGAAPPP